MRKERTQKSVEKNQSEGFGCGNVMSAVREEEGRTRRGAVPARAGITPRLAF